MIQLKPFSAVPQAIRVHAECAVDGHRILFTFKLSDPTGGVHDSLRTAGSACWPRADELWKTTCFEAFFAPLGEDRYWEVNFSPSRQSWNLYAFDRYRQPQPPRPCEDFTLEQVEMTADTLRAQLHAEVDLPPLEGSLCAVIRTVDGPQYFAAHHAGDKPDFHLRASFSRDFGR